MNDNVMVMGGVSALVPRWMRCDVARHARHAMMFALPPTADVCSEQAHVRFVPIASFRAAPLRWSGHFNRTAASWTMLRSEYFSTSNFVL